MTDCVRSCGQCMCKSDDKWLCTRLWTLHQPSLTFQLSAFAICLTCRECCRLVGLVVSVVSIVIVVNGYKHKFPFRQLTSIIRLLLTMLSDQRQLNLKEDSIPYNIDPSLTVDEITIT